jgi:hypothetical protein
MALYEQRIFSYNAMRDFDSKVDRAANKENIAGLINNDIENKQCFEELQSYNDTGKFLHVHSLTKELQSIDRLRTLRKTDPAQFTNELINCDKSITRYKSLIKNKKYKAREELADWQSLLRDYEVKRKLLTQIISE